MPARLRGFLPRETRRQSSTVFGSSGLKDLPSYIMLLWPAAPLILEEECDKCGCTNHPDFVFSVFPAGNVYVFLT